MSKFLIARGPKARLATLRKWNLKKAKGLRMQLSGDGGCDEAPTAVTRRDTCSSFRPATLQTPLSMYMPG